jgi:hypothetical protein
MKRTLLVILCVVAAAVPVAPAFSQQNVRIREIATVSAGDVRIVITATDEFGSIMGVRVAAHRGIDHIYDYVSPRGAWDWARRADSLVASPHRNRAGETLRAELYSPGGMLAKLVSDRGISYRLEFRDRYGINTATAVMSRTAVSAYINHIRRAGVVAGEMIGEDVTREPPPLPPLDLDRRPPLVGNPSWPFVADPVTKVFYRADCQGRSIIAMQRGAPTMQIVYFETAESAVAAGYSRARGERC